MKKKVVFVHGFMGGKTTWGKFPELLNDNFDCSVAEYGFDTSYWPFFGKSTTLHNLAEGLLSEIKLNCDLKNDELVLVGHSLGGLVIRQMLLNLELKGENPNIKKIAFFAVPQDGTGLANIAKYLPIRCNKLKALYKDGETVESLNDHWSYANLDLKYEILSVVGGKDAVVTSNSSKSIFRKYQVETNIDADHQNIVKPKDVSDFSYRVLEEFLNSSRTIDKYSNKASLSYDVWLRHDSRKHNSDYVTDEKRDDARRSLAEGLSGNKRLVRVSGLSGLGKSRLVLEYISSSDEINESNILIFNGVSYSEDIKACIAAALADKAVGLLVIDHCPVKLHNYISRDMDAMPSELRVVTLGFHHDTVESSYHVELEAMSTDSIREMISRILPDFGSRDVERITTFVEGYPLLALLIAERYRDDGVLQGQVSDQDFVDRLVNIDGPLSIEKQNILKLCSLFDVFGIQASRSDDAKFLYEMAEAKRGDFDQLITSFSDRQIINQVGDFGRVVPKPLAVFLAMQWWGESLDDSKKKLLLDMPDSLITSFCNQVKYLDSSIKVIDFVEGVCSRFSPFGQAELLLSNRGSRLFRGLVEVNPKATSSALYRIFQEISDDQIADISRDARRELVWALEMLCWHKSYFEKSAWCLLKLACFENESYSNNSTGQFAQLFRWQNSGTEADFHQRLLVLNRALKLSSQDSDLVVIEAIKQAVMTYGGSRILGAEQQGTKPEMREWIPEKWQQVFDYWEQMFQILLKLSNKTYATDLAKDTIGHVIRGMVSTGTIHFLDHAIRAIVESHGKYWPAAAESIIHALEYDSEKMPEEVKTALLGWQELLAPDKNNLEEQLTLIVLDPSREYEHDDKGELIDMAAQDAIGFANCLESVEELVPLFDFILTFQQQKQSWVFGREIFKKMDPDSFDHFFSRLLGSLIKSEKSRFEFVAGCLTGLHERDANFWGDIVDSFLHQDKLKPFYPDAIRSGRFGIDRLMVVVDLIREGHLLSQNAAYFTYGRVTHHLSEKEFIEFCSELSEVDEPGVWVALNILNMYMHGRKDYDYELLKPLHEKLLLSVSFAKEHKTRYHDGYHWSRSVEKLLKNGDRPFAVRLVDYLLDQVANNEIDFSDLWDNFHPALYGAFELCASDIWPSFSQNILELSESGPIYRLTDLLGSGKESRRKTNSIFTLVDEELVVNWCAEEKALLMVVRSLKLLDRSEDQFVPNRLLLRLIEKYSDNQYLSSEIRANYHSRSWTGSLVPYLEADKEALLPLTENKSIAVRQWAEEFISMLDHEVSENSKRDSEEMFVRGW